MATPANRIASIHSPFHMEIIGQLKTMIEQLEQGALIIQGFGIELPDPDVDDRQRITLTVASRFNPTKSRWASK